MPNSVKGFRYVQKTPITSSEGLPSNDFVCYWDLLMHTWITGPEACRLQLRSLLSSKYLKRELKGVFFETFATNRKECHRSVLFRYFLSPFLWTGIIFTFSYSFRKHLFITILLGDSWNYIPPIVVPSSAKPYG